VAPFGGAIDCGAKSRIFRDFVFGARKLPFWLLGIIINEAWDLALSARFLIFAGYGAGTFTLPPFKLTWVMELALTI